MTVNEIEQLAVRDENMPDGLDIGEQLLFITLRTLYSNFRSGAINKERGAREKQQILSAYKQVRLDCDIMQYYQQINQRVANHLEELYSCGCPHCKKLIELFSGIDRNDIPADIKTANEQIERLRDLVQERSERNAELMTTIDKVRWALEKNDIERVREIVNDHRNN